MNGLNTSLVTELKTSEASTFKVAVYVRTSTLSQAEEDKVSIPDQITWAENLCKEKGWEFVGSYVDTLPGDTEFDKRPEGYKLLEDAKFKLFNLVLFYHSSRLAREPWVGLKTISLLGGMGIQVHIRNAPIEPVPPQKYVYGSNIAAEYLNALSLVGDKQENIARSERVTSGFKNLAQRGVLVFAPYGYKKVSKIETSPDSKRKYTWYFEADPGKAAVVKRIINEYLRGKSLRKVTQGLIKDKIPSPSGKTGLESWSPATVNNILSDPAYIGKVRWGRKLGSKYRQGKTFTSKQKRVFTNSDKWILTKGNNVSKIIDKETFNQVQERLKQRGKVSGRQLASDSLLVGLVWCGECRRRAHCKTRRVKKPNGESYIRSDYIDQSYYRGDGCRRHLLSATKLEHLVLTRLQSRLKELREEDVGKQISEKETKSNQLLVGSLKQSERQLRGYDGKQSRLLDAYVSEIISKDDFTKQKDKLDNEQTVLIQEKNRIQSLLNDKEKKVKALETLKQLLEMFNKVTDPKIKKEMIQRIIESVVIYKRHIEVVYKYASEASESPYVKPHPCGFLGDITKECSCSPGQITRYNKRLSGPILDRIDLHIDVPAVNVKKLTTDTEAEKSESIRKRVQKARERQTARFKQKRLSSNSEMGPRGIKEFCKLDSECLNLLRAAVSKMQLSARAYHRILKVALTIADLEGSNSISPPHIAEALQYRIKSET